MLELVTFEFLENLCFSIYPSSRFAYLSGITVEKLFEEFKNTVKKQSERSFINLEKIVLHIKIKEEENFLSILYNKII